MMTRDVLMDQRRGFREQGLVKGIEKEQEYVGEGKKETFALRTGQALPQTCCLSLFGCIFVLVLPCLVYIPNPTRSEFQSQLFHRPPSSPLLRTSSCTRTPSHLPHLLPTLMIAHTLQLVRVSTCEATVINFFSHVL